MLTGNTFSGEQSKSIPIDFEVELVWHLTRIFKSQSEKMAVVDFYVSLKSKAMMILVNRSENGSLDLVNRFINVLIGDDYLQSQVLSGHPWWIRAHNDCKTLSQIHMRFLTEKILAMIEEASAIEAYVSHVMNTAPGCSFRSKQRDGLLSSPGNPINLA
jgi:hypothetical protein